MSWNLSVSVSGGVHVLLVHLATNSLIFIRSLTHSLSNARQQTRSKLTAFHTEERNSALPSSSSEIRLLFERKVRWHWARCARTPKHRKSRVQNDIIERGERNRTGKAKQQQQQQHQHQHQQKFSEGFQKFKVAAVWELAEKKRKEPWQQVGTTSFHERKHWTLVSRVACLPLTFRLFAACYSLCALLACGLAIPACGLLLFSGGVCDKDRSIVLLGLQSRRIRSKRAVSRLVSSSGARLVYFAVSVCLSVYPWIGLVRFGLITWWSSFIRVCMWVLSNVLIID